MVWFAKKGIGVVRKLVITLIMVKEKEKIMKKHTKIIFITFWPRQLNCSLKTRIWTIRKGSLSFCFRVFSHCRNFQNHQGFWITWSWISLWLNNNLKISMNFSTNFHNIIVENSMNVCTRYKSEMPGSMKRPLLKVPRNLNYTFLKSCPWIL